MRFLFQRHIKSTGAMVKYDDITGNLYTINEITADDSFYQTFGNLVLNFEKSTGRLFSVDGRIVTTGLPNNKIEKNNVSDFSYLVTGVLEQFNISDTVEYSFDPTSRLLSIKNNHIVDKGLQYAQVMDNVNICLTDVCELESVQIQF